MILNNGIKYNQNIIMMLTIRCSFDDYYNNEKSFKDESNHWK